MATSKAVHKVSNARHWARDEVICPKCGSGKGYPCIGKAGYMNDNEVHVARVQANGHSVRAL